MTTETEFRSADQEVIKLLEECSELKRTLRTVSAQLGRIENRVRAAFPVASKIVRERNSAASKQKASSLAPDQALAEFDHIVKLASSGATVDAENYVERKSASDLYAIAKEVGVIFQNNKPSIKTMREAILGRVRESILLSRHSPREQS